MINRQNNYKKNQKTTKRWQLALLVTLITGGIILGWYWQTTLLLIILYNLNELLNTDHHYYNPQQSFDWPLNSQHETVATIENRTILWQPTKQAQTWILECKITATLTGRIWDPYIEITDQITRQTTRQYLERGVKGKRYLNLTTFTEQLNQTTHALTYKTKHCQLKQGTAILHGFTHPNYTQQKILILAPHADDAELAAFGLYSQTKNTHIITLTAGETDTKGYQKLTGNKQKAGELKGKLRTLDSYSAAIWAGKKMENVTNLGYFGDQLQQMQQNPKQTLASTTTPNSTPKTYRQHNHLKLPTDPQPEATWEHLIKDLTYLIDHHQPDTIITPHPQLDPHTDHQATTTALTQSLQQTTHTPETILLYANHYHHTQHYPNGPAFTDQPLPPNFKTDNLTPSKIYCHPLNPQQQIDKYCVLNLMHDLRHPTKLKKHWRNTLQSWILKRPKLPIGNDDYLRKTIRHHEILYAISPQQLEEI